MQRYQCNHLFVELRLNPWKIARLTEIMPRFYFFCWRIVCLCFYNLKIPLLCKCFWSCLNTSYVDTETTLKNILKRYLPMEYHNSSGHSDIFQHPSRYGGLDHCTKEIYKFQYTAMLSIRSYQHFLAKLSFMLTSGSQSFCST